VLHIEGYAPTSLKVMIIDDDSDITLAFKTGLRIDGVAVQTFNDPKEAVESFRQDECGLVITDMRMPHMNGFEVYRAIKAMRPDVPVWFLTAFEITSLEMGKMFPDLAVEKLLKKPISIIELKRLILEVKKRQERI
jgi:DNA-binding response OmpR family regulator